MATQLSPRAGGRRAVARPAPAVSLVIANGNASRVTPELVAAVRAGLRRGGRPPAVVVTRSAADVDACLPRDPEQRVVLVGGDGTLHAVVGLGGRLPELALVPAGGAGNVARSLGLSPDVRRAVEIARNGSGRPFDLIHQAGSRGAGVVVEGVSVGALAEARALYRGRNSTARGRALAGGLRALVRHRPIPLVVELDGQSHEVVVSQLFIANTPLYGPRLRVSPDASTDDGLLDVVAYGPRTRRGLCRLFRQLRGGAVAPDGDARRWRAARARILPLCATAAFGDSRALGPGPVELEVSAGALRIVGPR